ncbi:MAG: hypothetical protein Q9168_001485 [Polycauliona sp. 1 TL-2023]
MADSQPRLDEFLRPPIDQSHWTSFIQQKRAFVEQEELYKEAYGSLYPGEDAAESKEDHSACWNKIVEISDYQRTESMHDKSLTSKERAWNIWLTARHTLMTAVLKFKGHMFMPVRKLREDLGVCANSATYAQKSFKENKDPEWGILEAASKLCAKSLRKMSDLRERLQKLLTPQIPDSKLDEYEQLITKKYKYAYKAFYQEENRTKCYARLLEIGTAVKEEARKESVWQSYILCQAFLLGSIFEARVKALDNLDQVRRKLALFSPNRAKTGSYIVKEDHSEMSDLTDQLCRRIRREKEPEFLKETWWFHSTTTWPIRMTDGWLEATEIVVE